ncbi:hypothetical protein ARMSODRAFT_656945 [Armillaria solidipes]|uniref:Uncharacterized protein n=1 Tax=Armillaria solidipes TaxID=1076256 RepID=A0A2H3BCR0_9AGAR|nr:hypothetical protein ARMSODRAFT_656945 [Armillaria solidipes]
MNSHHAFSAAELRPSTVDPARIRLHDGPDLLDVFSHYHWVPFFLSFNSSFKFSHNPSLFITSFALIFIHGGRPEHRTPHRRHCSGGSGLRYPCVRRPRNLGRCGFFSHHIDSLPIPPCSAPYYMVQFLCVLDNILHFIHSPCHRWTSIRGTANIWSLCHSSGSDLCGSSSDGLYNILISPLYAHPYEVLS